MSNSWVLHGSRTASGRPILANDPHLAVEMPSVWWEVHVVANTVNVAGVTIPGVPFVIIGHNERVGWGLTNVGADVQDFFEERLDAARERYQQGLVWLPLDVVRHAIRVRGRDRPVEFAVKSTSRGPVLSTEEWHEPQPGVAGLSPERSERALALRWDVGRGESAAAFDAISRAHTWEAFVAAVRRFSAPSQNFVYADIDGNIGYAMSGLLPIRTGGGQLPLRGWEDGSDWRGFRDPRELPVVDQPADGQIVTANNEVDRALQYAITDDWVAPFRARRILELLGDRRALDVTSMRAIQADITSRSADHILRSIDVPDSVKSLTVWDRRVDERGESLLYEVFEEALWRRTFADEMPRRLYDQFYRYAGNERFAGLHAIIGDLHSPWFDDRSTPAVETRDDIVRRAADEAMTNLVARFGEQHEWRWDNVHAVTFTHALAGGGRLLDWFFSRGPVALAGDSMTVNKTTTNLRRPYATSDVASYRQILDVGDWDRSLGVNTTGQSGHPRSRHYFDQNGLWRYGQYRALPFTRQAVVSATVSQLELIP